MNRPFTPPQHRTLAPTGVSGGGKPNSTLFRIYVAYRSLLSVVLLLMLISPDTRQLVGGLNPALYIVVATGYLATSVLLTGALSASWYRNHRFLFLVFTVDIAAITLLADSSGGMVSGLPVLLVITVAAGAVMLANRTLATLVAALSVLAILGDTLRLLLAGHAGINALFSAGLLGLLLFGVSLLVQAIASRLGHAEALARARASDLYNLQRLNEQIVQHMQTGILLVSGDGGVRVMNKAAASLLAWEHAAGRSQGRTLADYGSELTSQYARWRNTGLHRASPFSVQEGGPPLVANFRELQPGIEGEALVFVDDYSPVTQHAQTLKLSSLGRLTASIAHEVRNPLGAISHAAQLLQESPELSAGDRRMAEIILEHSRRVNEIVESVMQISRREPPKPEYLLLAEWLETFVEDYLATLNRAADITVDCSFRDLLIEFDPENLRRVLGNLLDNALRHSRLATGRERARIAVELDFNYNQCLIDVIDYGKGVPPADRSKLFEPFFTTVESGSGMGLFLCKELCEINNASLSYAPTPAGESRFRLALGKRAL